MADDVLKKFSSTIDDLSAQTSKSLRGTSKSHYFFDDKQFESFDDVLAIFDRSDLLVQLKTLLTQPHTAADWAVPKSKMEYLSGWERDVRALRRNRLDRYRASSQQKAFISTNIDQYVSEMDRINSQQTS